MAKEKYRCTIEPVSLTEHSGHIVVVGRVSGDFPGSPVEVSQVFTLDGGNIVSLEIHS